MASPVAVLSVVLLVACAAHGARLSRQFQGEVSPDDGCVVGGVTYPIGAVIPDDNPCQWCHCSGHHGPQLFCVYVKSDGVSRTCLQPNYPPPCADAVYTEGDQCCPGYWTCPNGPNCSIGGQIVSPGQSIDMGDGMTCSCEGNGGWSHWQAQYWPSCITTTRPPPTTTTPRPTITTPRPTPTTTTPTYY
ncbi:uncharacterized protein LOC118415851 [Branchiostoma floridae]|uniref:Uncharacterized protein LOC118415851 n=1 Tax=Branchiostoma floridae TaxID=7739 RepID=C3YAQ1_BRAFL|nr:uncharacterized protein LOC118415851 [Branchiostoma floridae]|eukprot:XP_002606789.1 hypothetical protein BRAFLDRAFT_82431 [Branchiostoma floridae]